MPQLVFEWDAENSTHFAHRGITTDEAEAVVRDPRNDVNRSRTTGWPITFGRTKSNRYIAVVSQQVGIDPIRIRIITAQEVARPGGNA